MKDRLSWIDWMKVIGIYLIVAGHFTPPNFNILYVFSVQLFLLLSGYLTKKKSSGRFYKDLFSNIIFPMVIICSLNIGFDYLLQCIRGNLNPIPFLEKLLGIIIGNQRSLGPCWFLYSLAIIQILAHISSHRVQGLLFIVFTIALLLYNQSTLDYRNAIVNTAICYPMFYIGKLMKPLKPFLCRKINVMWLLLGLVTFGLIVYYCSHHNSIPWLWLNRYGDSILIYMLGSLSGTALIFCLAKLLEHRFNYTVAVLADGNILILGFHFTIIRYLFIFNLGYSFYVIAFVIVCCFFPIILIVKKYIPVLIGSRAAHHSK